MKTWQDEAQEILRELLNGEFRDLKDPGVKDTWIYFIPMRRDWLACNLPFTKLRCRFIFIKENALGKKINSRTILREILRHELLHVRLDGADCRDSIFRQAAARLKIPLSF